MTISGYAGIFALVVRTTCGNGSCIPNSSVWIYLCNLALVIGWTKGKGPCARVPGEMRSCLNQIGQCWGKQPIILPFNPTDAS
jgi:hypothetical protein